MAAYADVAQKTDQVDADLAKEDEALAALDSDLEAAEARVEAAQERYLRARRAAERAEKEGQDASAGVPAQSTKTAEGQEVELADTLSPDKAPTLHGCPTAKNAGARTDKEVSRARWEAARAAEVRVRDRAVKARDKLRRSERDRKFQQTDQVPSEAAAEAAEAAAAEAPAPAAAPEKAAPKARPAAADTPAVKEGAKGIVERLQSLKGRPTPADKHDGLLKIAQGGKDNYYTCEPSDVLADLTERVLLEDAFSKELVALLKEASTAKAAAVPPEGWAAGAQKASGIERLEDNPYTAEEDAYLKYVEVKGLLSAEAELAAAEMHLQGVISKAEETYGDLGDDEPATKGGSSLVTGEVEVDEDEAERLEAQYDPDGHRESKGSKNSSALPSKVLSHERYQAARGKESREREHDVKSREVRRTEARDRKQGATEEDA